MTLLVRLFALVLLAVMPALSMQAYSVFQLRAERERELTTTAERLLHLAEGEQARVVDGARLMVTAIAESAAVHNADWERCRGHLRRLARHAPEYRGLAVVDRDGTVLCSGTADVTAAGARSGFAPASGDAGAHKSERLIPEPPVRSTSCRWPE